MKIGDLITFTDDDQIVRDLMVSRINQDNRTVEGEIIVDGHGTGQWAAVTEHQIESAQ